MRFTGYPFGSIRVDGMTYDHDLIIDRGRKKAASRKFRGASGHTRPRQPPSSASSPRGANHQDASSWSWPSLRRQYHALPAPVQWTDAVGGRCAFTLCARLQGRTGSPYRSRFVNPIGSDSPAYLAPDCGHRVRGQGHLNVVRSGAADPTLLVLHSVGGATPSTGKRGHPPTGRSGWGSDRMRHRAIHATAPA